VAFLPLPDCSALKRRERAHHVAKVISFRIRNERLVVPRFIRLLSLTCLTVFAGLVHSTSLMAAEAIEVRIGATHFPPYTIRPEQNVKVGLLAQLAQALNQAQPVYHFVLVPTSVPRRFADLEQGRTDMAIFENPAWGWQNVAHSAVDLGLEDAEIFVAARKAGRDQRFFDDLRGKHLALFHGYHYAFASFNADTRFLQQTYGATLTYSHDSNLYMLERGRADIALVTRSYFNDFLLRHPEQVERLMASERVDQTYRHYALLRPEAPISAQDFAQLVERLRASGELERIFAPYQVRVATRL